MTTLGDPRRHYWLVKGMAKATGVDLVGAVEQGRLTASEWAQTVQSCRACDWVDGCSDWLKMGGIATVPPRSCRNRARMAMLRLEQELEG